MSTVFLRSGGAIFEEVYSDARWCRSRSKREIKTCVFFPSASQPSQRPPADCKEGWLEPAGAPGKSGFSRGSSIEQEGSVRGPTSSYNLVNQP